MLIEELFSEEKLIFSVAKIPFKNKKVYFYKRSCKYCNKIRYNTQNQGNFCNGKCKQRFYALKDQKNLILEENIKCHICGFLSKDLTKHIHNIHGISSDEYKKLFPNSRLVKKSSALKRKKTQLETYKRIGSPIAWNKDKTKHTDKRLEKTGKSISNAKKGTLFVNREFRSCKNCGKEFLCKITSSQRFCSKKCVSNQGFKHTIEEIEKIIANRKYKAFKYKEIYMRSSWEVRVAKWLDENNIKWEYESKNCVFQLSNNRIYIIDFYLPELNKYIEVKGYWDEYSIQKFNEAKSKLNICIVDERNIDDINLKIQEVLKNEN